MSPCFDREVASLLMCTEGVHETDCEDNAESSNSDQLGCNQGGKTTFHVPRLEDDDYIFLLMQKEDSQMNEIRGYIDSYQGKGAELRLRAQTVNWMLDVHAYYGFGSLTAFLSVSYFDRFLSKHAKYRGKTWLLQLAAIGSISLAAKLQETEVPLLTDLQVGDIEHVFESYTIQRMELLILSTLNWEMISVTPFSYLHYLLQKCDFLGGLSQALISRSEELIMLSSKGNRFLAYSPSVVAVASLVSACKEEVPWKAACLQRALLSIWPAKETEVMEWACLMDEMLQGEPGFWNSPLNKVTFSKSSAPQSPMGVLDVACFSSESCDRTLNAPASTTVCCASRRSVCKRLSIHTNSALRPISLTNETSELAASARTDGFIASPTAFKEEKT